MFDTRQTRLHVMSTSLAATFRQPKHHTDTAVVELTGHYPAIGPTNPLKALVQRVESLESLGLRVRRLIEDDEITTVLVRVVGLATGPATAMSIQTLLRELADHKRVIAHLHEVTMLTVLATAGVTEVTAPRSASVMIFGFAAEQLFLGKFLRTHGIEFENLRIAEYKSALTRFSDDHMDEHNREQLSAYLSSVEREWIDRVAQGRSLPRDKVAGWLDEGIAHAGSAAQAGVLDRVAYEDELVTDVVDARGGWESVLESVRRNRPGRGQDRIALVSVTGAIVSGRPQSVPLPPPFGPGKSAWSSLIVQALRHAERDERTVAIVVHVDSGGGSALASDLISREIETCTKPVIAVMGEVAGSGGYYVLAHADRVLASPFTLTGSIGVVTGKPVLADFHERHGFTPEAVGREQALVGSPARPFTDEQRGWMQAMMDEVYRQFTETVAVGRGLTPARVDELGRGRIWSGRDARERGLIDDYGDVASALRVARELAGVAHDTPVWHPAPRRSFLPTTEVGKAVRSNVLAQLWPFGGERVLTWMDAPIRVH